MPTVIIDGYKFRFYSSDLNEPPHMHVLHGEKEAKIWLQPISLEYNHGYGQAEMNRVLRLASQNLAQLMEAWNGYFHG